jgi:hypothetical protein
MYLLYNCIYKRQIAKLVKPTLAHNYVHFYISFILKTNSIIKMPFHIRKIMKKCGLVLPLQNSYSFHVVKWELDLNVFVFKIMTMWSFQKCCFFYHGFLLTFGCGKWDFELHWTKSDIELSFNSLSKCLCLVCKFEILNLDALMLLFVFVSPSFSKMEPLPHCFFWWALVRLENNYRCHLNLFLKKWILTLDYFEISLFTKKWFNKWLRS